MPFLPQKDELWDLPKPCMSREHNPPTMIVLKPGTHIWICPLCGQEQMVYVPRILCGAYETTLKWFNTKASGITKRFKKGD